MNLHNFLILAISLLLVACTYAETVDDMKVNVTRFYRGYSQLGDFDSSTKAPAREQIQIDFNVLATQPEEFSWDLLNTVRFYQPTDPISGMVIDSSNCTSNGITVTMTDTVDKDSTVTTTHSIPVSAFPTTFSVNKNGVTTDTAVSCTFYYTIYEKYSYPSYEVFSYYDSNSADVVLTLYTVDGNIYLETSSQTVDGVANTVMEIYLDGSSSFTIADDFSFLFLSAVTPATTGDLVIYDTTATKSQAATCTTANNMLYTCTWTTLPSDTSSYIILFTMKTPAYSPLAPLFEFVFTLPTGEQYYLAGSEFSPVPVLSTSVIRNKATEVTFTFSVPFPDDMSLATATFTKDSSDDSTVEMGSTCTSGDTVFANIVYADSVFTFTFTDEAIASLGGTYQFSCDAYVYTDASSTYTFTAGVTGLNGWDETDVEMSVINPARLDAVGIRAGYEYNFISFSGRGSVIAAGTTISITGVSFPTDVTATTMQCSSSTSSNDREDIDVVVDSTTLSLSAVIGSTAMRGCSILIPDTGVLTTVSLYSNGVLTDTKDFVETAAAEITVDSPMGSGNYTSAVTFTVPQVPIDLVTSSYIFTIDGVNIQTVPYVECHTDGPDTEIDISCTANNFVITCDMKTITFTGIGYADVICSARDTYSDRTPVEDITIDMTSPFGSETIAIPALTVNKEPTIDVRFAEKYLSIGDNATLIVEVFNIVFDADDEIVLEFKENGTPVEFFDASKSATVYSTDISFTSTALTIKCTAAHFFDGASYKFEIADYPVAMSGANFDTPVAIFTPGGTTNAGRSVLNSIVIPSYAVKADDDLTLTPSGTSAVISVNYTTTNRQSQTISVNPGTYNSAAIITGTANVQGCTVTLADGVYTTTISSTGLEIGEQSVCTFDLEYVYNYECSDCTNAPTVTLDVTDKIPETSTITSLVAGLPNVTLTKTYGAFTSESAGFVLKLEFATVFPTLSNIFGFTSTDDHVPIYEVTEDAVGETMVGYFALPSAESTVLTLTLQDFDIITSVGTLFSTAYLAVPVFDADFIFPTMSATTLTVTVGDDPFTIALTNTPTYTVTTVPPTSILEEKSFLIDFSFTSTALDALTVQLDFTNVPATLEGCTVANTTDDATATEEDMVAAIDVPTTLATVSFDSSPMASYGFSCNFTALDATTYKLSTYNNTAVVNILYNSEIVKTAEMVTPTLSRNPVSVVKLVNSFSASATLSASDISRILVVMSIAIQSVVSTFTINNFHQISQVYTPSSPSSVDTETVFIASHPDITNAVDVDPTSTLASIRVLADGTAELTVYISGATTAQVTESSTSMANGFTSLGVTAEIGTPEDAEIEADCEESCGGECGMCRNGAACTESIDCFSGLCTDSVCASESGSAVISTVAAVVVAVVASAMLL